MLSLFSKYKTFANPVAKAWVCGKPTIVSDQSGIVSFMNSELGTIVPADSASLLGLAMNELYEKR